MAAYRKKIAIIGAGSSGLAAIKCCKEDNLDVVCFEKTDTIGGLWYYRDDDLFGVASVMKTTVINTSKEMSAFTDFPPPKDFSNYMHNSQMFKYFQMYAKKFDLLQHIEFHREVLKVTPADDYSDTGRWKVMVRDPSDNITEDIFDGVMVCIGHHVFPNVPSFPGQEEFKGEVLHTHSLKNTKGFEDKKIVVVGIGNSAVDAAVDLSAVSEKLYLSSRRGSWIFQRVGPDGQPADATYFTRVILSLFNIVPYRLMCWYTERKLNKVFDHKVYNLKPKHRAWSGHPTINDALPNKILSGRITVKGDIEKFYPTGIMFKGENQITEIDTVVLATGYRIEFPFLHDVLQTVDNQVELYKYMFPVNLKYPSLVIIGLVQVVGCVFPVAEMQCRWYTQLMNGKSTFPSKKTMMEDIKSKRKAVEKRYVPSLRHTIQADFVPYMNELANQFGAKPNFFKMALTDPKLFWACVTGPCLPYQYRLIGPYPWPKARQAILTYDERYKSALKTKSEEEKSTTL